MHILQNSTTGLFARFNSRGEHDQLKTDDIADAKGFPTFGAASEYGQNFGDEWHPVAFQAVQTIH